MDEEELRRRGEGDKIYREFIREEKRRSMQP